MMESNGELREWWADPAASGPSSPPTFSTGLRARSALEQELSNVMLPPRPSDLVTKEDEALAKFMDDEAFLDSDDENKPRGYTLSRFRQNVRNSLNGPAVAVLCLLVLLSFLAGYELSHLGAFDPSEDDDGAQKKGRGRVPGRGGGSGVAGGAGEEDDRPMCGSQYAIAGGQGYGGHNDDLGCVSKGRMTWAMCLQVRPCLMPHSL